MRSGRGGLLDEMEEDCGLIPTRGKCGSPWRHPRPATVRTKVRKRSPAAGASLRRARRAGFSMRVAERCMDVTNEVVGESRWRGRANGPSATTYGGGEAATVTRWARVAQLAKPERAFHSAAPRLRQNGWPGSFPQWERY